MSLIWWALGWNNSSNSTSTVEPLVDRRKYLTWNYNEIDTILSEIEYPYKQISYCASLDTITEVDHRNLEYYFKCYDQLQLGSCTAQGWIFEYVFDMGKQGEKQVDMSRLAFYYCERKILGTTDSDSGAQISTGAQVMLDNGVCLESLWPYDISKYTENPPENCWADMQLHKGIKVERVKKTIRDLKQCLIDGYPFVFGFRVYESFMNVGSDGIVKNPDIKKEKCLGGHCVACVGFKKINGKDYFIIRNSWGCNSEPGVEPVVKGWGDNGHCYMEFDFLTETTGLFGLQQMCSDFWVMKVVKDEQDPNIPKTKNEVINEILSKMNEMNITLADLSNEVV